MAEQTRVKNITAQEKYLEELRDTEAYKLLRFAFLHGLLTYMPNFNKVVATYLDTGIVETEVDILYGKGISNETEGSPLSRSFYPNGR